MPSQPILKLSFFTSLLCLSLVAAAQCGSMSTFGISGFGGLYSCPMWIDANGVPYAVFDHGIGHKATAIQWSNNSWGVLGGADFSAGVAKHIRVAKNSADIPYICYSDGGNGAKVTVMGYVGYIWTTIGSAGFSSGSVTYPAIAVGTNDTPFVFFDDVNYGSVANVMKYNGSSWVQVGSSGFSAGAVSYNVIAADGSGTIYVGYSDNANGDKATVMKYSGNSWVNVGSAGFSASSAAELAMAIDGNGTPYVAYRDDGNSGKATVMKYNGSSWVNVGSAGFSAGTVSGSSLAFDGNNVPYITYRDAGLSDKVALMKYDGSSWVALGCGNAGISAGVAKYSTVAIDVNGSVYAGYQDSTILYAGFMVKKFTPGLPDISPGGTPVICLGDTSAKLNYSANVNSATQYSIVWNASAAAAGFVNVSNASLPASPISIAIPGSAGPGTYSGALTISNCSCIGNSHAFSIIIDSLIPTSITISGPTVSSPGNNITMNAVVNSAGALYNIVWLNKGSIFNTTTGPSVTYTKGPGNDTIRAVIVVTSPGCYKIDTSQIWIVRDSTAGIPPSPLKGGLSVYPNPFGDKISIRGLEAGDRICVYDLLGRRRTEVREIESKNAEQTISLKELPGGTYFLHVWDGAGESKANIELLKQR